MAIKSRSWAVAALAVACILLEISCEAKSLPSIPTNVLAPAFTWDPAGWVQPIEVSPDGSRIALISGDVLTLRDDSGKILWSYDPPETIRGREVYLMEAMPIASDKTLVVLRLNVPITESEDAQVLAFDGSGQVMWEKRLRGVLAGFSASGDVMLISGPGRRELQLLHTSDGGALWGKNDLPRAGGKFSPDGMRILLLTAEEPAMLIDRAGRTMWSIPFRPSEAVISEGAERLVLRGRILTEHGLKPVVAVHDGAGKERWRKYMDTASVAIDRSGMHILVGEDTATQDRVTLLDGYGSVVWRSPAALGIWTCHDDLWVSPDGLYAMFTTSEPDARYLCQVRTDGVLIKRWKLSGAGVPEDVDLPFLKFSDDGRILCVNAGSGLVYKTPLVPSVGKPNGR